MKPFHRSVKRDELKILEDKLDSLCTERAAFEEDHNTKYSIILDEISGLTLRRINTFPPNVPCTLGKLSNVAEVSIEQVEHHMICTIPSNCLYERSMYDLVDAIDTITPNRICTGLTGIYVVMQPNWIFTKLCSNNTMLIERIEWEMTE